VSRQKKILLWIIGTIGTLSILLLGLFLLLPTLINLEMLRERIEANLSKKAGVKLDFQGLELDFFPRPCGLIRQASLSIPEKADGTLESLKVYPKIIPLLIGKFRVSELQVKAPHFKVQLPERPEKKEQQDKERAFAWEAMKKKVASRLALATLQAPGLVVVVEDGRLELFEKKKSILQLEGIGAHVSLPIGKLTADVTCASNLWDKASFETRMDLDDFKGNGQINVRYFRPHMLPEQLFPPNAPHIRDSHVNLKLKFETEALKVLWGEVQGSIPRLAVDNGNGTVVIKGESLKGVFRTDKDKTTVSLRNMNLDYPQGNVRGEWVWDRAAPHISLELKGKNVDVSSARKAALALAGKFPITHKLCDAIRGGKVPEITFSTHGSTPEALGKVEHITLKGNMTEGDIMVQVGQMNWKDVKGEVFISQGILEAKNLQGQLGQSRAWEGTLKMGLKDLKEKNAPFHLDVSLEADLSQLPSILKRIVKNPSFLQQMDLIDDLQGNATGRLVLGDNMGSIKTHVDVSKSNMVARYRPIPYPLEIKRGTLFHDGKKIDLKTVTGKIGKSSFSGLSARLDWRKEPYIEAKSGMSRILLDEVYPWLMSYKRLSEGLKNLKSLMGAVEASALSLEGPVLKPKSWKFRVAGEVKDIAVDTTLLPKPVTVIRGGFTATPDKISVTDAQTDALGASLNVSGLVEGYQKGVDRTEMAFSGTMKPEAIKWVSGIIHLPRELYIRSPVSIPHGNLTWQKGGGTTFSGDLAIANGPKISMDIMQDREALTVKELLVQDQKSNASITFNRKEGEIGLGFSGELHKSTLDLCLVENVCLEGWIKGDLQARVSIDQPARSIANGSVKAENIILPWILNVPTKIENIALGAGQDNLKVESAIVVLGDDRITLEGNVGATAEGFVLDMNLLANEVEWEHVRKVLGLDGEDGKEKEAKNAKDSWDLPVRGVLRLQSGGFVFGGFNWSPFHADISIDRNKVSIDVKEADLCGSIASPGRVSVFPQEVQLEFKPAAKGQEFDATLACLANKKGLMVGKFDFDGEVTGRGKQEEVKKFLRGDLKLTAGEGRIYRANMLAKIFAILNVTEIFRGQLPDLRQEGFAYRSITAKGSLKDGKVILSEVIVDGSSMKIFSEGDINLMDKKLDLRVAVAPFKTVDFIVNNIPFVGYILGGSLVSIPMSIKGDWTDPAVSPLSTASAIGSGLLGIIERTVKLPVKVIEPLASGEKKE
jgi:uncharacterized protein involved in outer membrane biogenesis